MIAAKTDKMKIYVEKKDIIMSAKRNTKDGLYDILVHLPQVETDNYFIEPNIFVVPNIYMVFFLTRRALHIFNNQSILSRKATIQNLQDMPLIQCRLKK